MDGQFYEHWVILGLPYALQNYVIVYSKLFTFLNDLYYELNVGCFCHFWSLIVHVWTQWYCDVLARLPRGGNLQPMLQPDYGTIASGWWNEKQNWSYNSSSSWRRQVTWLPLPVVIVIGIWAYYMRDEESIAKGSDRFAESLYLTVPNTGISILITLLLTIFLRLGLVVLSQATQRTGLTIGLAIFLQQFCCFYC